MNWDDVSFVLRSRTRKSVLTKLETEKTPTILARELKTSIPNISRALRELKAKGLVITVTPNARVGRIYSITEEGRVVLAKVKEISRVDTV